jgi:hypothetical protein
VCLLCGFDQGDAESLISHVKEHASESSQDHACLFADCEFVSDDPKAKVRHLLQVHYLVKWLCGSCDEVFDLRERALLCDHSSSQKGSKKRAKIDGTRDGEVLPPPPLMEPTPPMVFARPGVVNTTMRRASPPRRPPPRVIIPNLPQPTPDDQLPFVMKVQSMLARMGVSQARMPSPAMLASTLEEVQALPDHELEPLVQSFVGQKSTMERVTGRLDLEWLSFWRERKEEEKRVKSAGATRRGSSSAGPRKRSIVSVVRKAPPLAPNVVLSGQSSSNSAAADESIGLEDVLMRAKRTMVLLDESDQQLRHSLNLLAAARRRISDLEASTRASRKKVKELSQHLMLSQTQNRDLRVKMLYDEREHHRQIDRIVRESKEGSAVSFESANAIGQLKELKQELILLVPVFPDEIVFEPLDLLFVQSNGIAEPVGVVRSTRDLSGRRWLVWTDLKACSSPALTTLLNSPEAMPLLTEQNDKRLMERVLCFRPFSTKTNDGSNSDNRDDLLVSWDWPKFGGGLEERRR